MEQFNLFPNLITTTQVLITVFSPELLSTSLKIASLLRLEGINTDIYPNSSSKLDKQLKYADKKKIPYVIIIGPAEKEKGIVKLKNLKTREQKDIEEKNIATYIKSQI